MRHERPQPGQPSPIEIVNAAIFTRRVSGAYQREARADIKPGATLGEELRDAVITDMVELLDEGRIQRGYADIFDLARAGYHADIAAGLGPLAAKILAKRIAERGENARADDDMEAA